MDETHPILQRIRDTDAELAANAEKRRQLDIDDARLVARREAYADAYELVTGQRPVGVEKRYDARASKPAAARRGISPMWQRLLSQTATSLAAEFGVDDVMHAAEIEGANAPSRSAIRSQLANYANRGTVERIRNGVFRLTPEGAAEIGLEFSNEASASDENAPPDVGGADAGGALTPPDECQQPSWLADRT